MSYGVLRILGNKAGGVELEVVKQNGRTATSSRTYFRVRPLLKKKKKKKVLAFSYISAQVN